jgi:hypothetical protein
MPERKYPWSNNKNQTKEYLKEQREIRKIKDLPTGRIDDELRYREEVEQQRDAGSKENNGD